MASIRKEIVINAPLEDVWDALRDWGALHQRVAPGFVTEAKLDGKDRIVTFFNGTTVREVLLNRDDDARRLAWSIVGGPYTHHNGSAQVFPERDGRARFVWVADLLPESLTLPTAEMMERGIQVIKQTLESAARY